MSTPNQKKHSNGKIHRYPLRACKLLCFTKDTYKRIVWVVRGFKKKRPADSSSLKKHKSTKKQLVKSSYRLTGSYEPSNICDTPNNKIRQWGRVKAWFKEFKEDYNAS